ncbi:MAG TPA: SRPBCC family protein [Acidimicrobiia bacterium]|nr:SRPBCC family protein [Acidimicrobiia bacterium]
MHRDRHHRRPRATVFPYLANLEHNPDWNWAILATQPLQAGPGRRGSRFHQSSKSADSATLLEITKFMPNRLLEVSSQAGKATARYRYQFANSPTGGTELTLTTELRPGHRLPRPDLYASRTQLAVRENLQHLKVVIEDIVRAGITE